LDNIDKVGQYQYRKVLLTSSRGETVDIATMVEGFNIYEDIYSNTMSGSMVILDASGLMATLPIIGQEVLTVEYELIGSPIIKLQFVVFKVERKNRVHNAEMLQLHLVSQEAYVSTSSVISRAYKGNNSSIVADVFTRYLGSKRKLLLEKTKGENHCICPKWNPFYFINWLAARSIPEQGSLPSYLFYENVEGFNFVSLESLFKQKEVYIWKHQMENAYASENAWTHDKIQYNLATILKYNVLESNDFIMSQMEGMMNTEMYVVDYKSNGFKKVYFDYLTTFKKSAHLNSHPLITERATPFGYKYDSPGQTRVVYDNTAAHEMDTNRYSEWVLQRMSFMQQLSGQRIQLDVAGQGMVKVGDVVKLEFPLLATAQTGKDMLDPLISGRYLITALHHNFSPTTHSMSVECCKDSTLPLPKIK